MTQVVIVDYGLGNLFSVQQACRHVGLETVISRAAQDLDAASGVILPGVGAFGNAMESLNSAGFSEALKRFAASGKPLLGICLGLQLLMSESQEFGRHQGLGIIEGDVITFARITPEGKALKVPHIGWDPILEPSPSRWSNSFLAELPPGQDMYFVHSFYVRPTDAGVCLSITDYGSQRFCSSLQHANVWGCQFHPERSGPGGLKIYRAFARAVSGIKEAHFGH